VLCLISQKKLVTITILFVATFISRSHTVRLPSSGARQMTFCETWPISFAPDSFANYFYLRCQLMFSHKTTKNVQLFDVSKQTQYIDDYDCGYMDGTTMLLLSNDSILDSL